MIFGVKILNFVLAIALMFGFVGAVAVGLKVFGRFRSDRQFLQCVGVLVTGGAPLLLAVIQRQLVITPDRNVITAIFATEFILGLVVIFIMAFRETKRRRLDHEET